MVAVVHGQLLKQRCPSEGISLQIIGGESFLDQAFLRFGFDPIEGFQLLDATQLKPLYVKSAAAYGDCPGI